MRSASISAILFFACLSVAACSQSIGGNGNGVGNGTGVDGGFEVTCDNPNAQVCEAQCVDTDVDPTFCGTCENSCAEGQGCSAGSCVDLCDPGFVNCGGVCIDPLTDGNFCGASGTCTVDTQGEACGTNSCINGACASQRYLGSLPETTGRWNFGGALGVAGAELQCRNSFQNGLPLAQQTAVVCSYAQLLDAQAKGELATPLDSAGAPVTSWYILDAAQNIQRQCTKTDVANPIPWSYETADLGQGSRFAVVNIDGAVGAEVDAPSAGADGCRTLRNVPCCIP